MEFWHNRWMSQQTGWHRAEFNDLLVKHWSTIGATAQGEVLVPLCGKSLDMVWLAEQGHTVVGLDMVKQAIETFFEEQGLEVESTEHDHHTRHVHPPFTLLHGNVLEIKPKTVQADAWYDRAAMIALPVESREAYVAQLRQQTKPGAVGLLITFAYPQEQMQGPPFSLQDEHVFELFSEGFDVECLETRELEDEKERGLSSLSTSVFKIQKT
jgi:thiopurine S-methyltransferase